MYWWEGADHTKVEMNRCARCVRCVRCVGYRNSLLEKAVSRDGAYGDVVSMMLTWRAVAEGITEGVAGGWTRNICWGNRSERYWKDYLPAAAMQRQTRYGEGLQRSEAHQNQF